MAGRGGHQRVLEWGLGRLCSPRASTATMELAPCMHFSPGKHHRALVPCPMPGLSADQTSPEMGVLSPHQTGSPVDRAQDS